MITECVKMASSAFDSDVVGVALAIVDVTAAKPVAREITKASELTNSPDWSAATNLIVFARPSTSAGFDGPSDLVTIHPDGTGRTTVTSVLPRGGQTPQPARSPDGNNPDWSRVSDRIVCTKPLRASGFDGPADLDALRPDGTGFAPLTALAASGGDAIKPTWLPDGSGVIFNDSNGWMSTILADGTGLAPAISHDPIPGLHPRLRPTP